MNEKNRSIFKTVLYSTLSTIAFAGSLISSLFSGRYLYKNFSGSITPLIDQECKNQKRGEAIFASIEYEYSEENIQTINKAKTEFDEKLMNQLSKAEMNVTISIPSINYVSNDISIMETKSYDENYDNMHIYSGYRWYYFDEKVESVYISSYFEKTLIAGTGLQSLKDNTITVTANGVSKDLVIAGTYLSGVYPNSGTGLSARADGLIKSFGETILMHEEIINEFKPSKAFAMFALGSSNNGGKYEQLKNVCKKNNFEFNFNLDPLPESTLNKDIETIEKYYSSSQKIFAGIGFLFLSLSLEALTMFLLIKLMRMLFIDDMKKWKDYLYTSLIGVSIVLISAVILLIFKQQSFVIAGGIKGPWLSLVSLLLFLIPVATTFIYYLFNRRKTVLILFKDKENNSEFDY